LLPVVAFPWPITLGCCRRRRLPHPQGTASVECGRAGVTRRTGLAAAGRRACRRRRPYRTKARSPFGSRAVRSTPRTSGFGRAGGSHPRGR
jgi:hypothetical protein